MNFWKSDRGLFVLIAIFVGLTFVAAALLAGVDRRNSARIYQLRDNRTVECVVITGQAISCDWEHAK